VGVRLLEHLETCSRCREEAAEQREFADIERAYETTSALPPPQDLRRDFESTSAPLPPQVPNYTVLRWLGRGGFGDVWLARHPVLGLRALKVLNERQFDERALDRLVEEARVMASLKPHPNPGQAFDLIRPPGGAGLVMAYVEGGPLSRQAPRNWERAVRYTAQVADGLRAVHAKGLLHRDIKPVNILWDREDDAAVLGDFGLATRAGGPPGLA